MIRLACLAIALACVPAQDRAKIDALVQKLSDPDWVEQAKAAKELSLIGKPASASIGLAGMGESSSARYWAPLILEKINGPAARPPGPAPAPAAAAASEPDLSGFAPGEDDIGSIMFICNTASHGDREVIISMCGVCCKAKKFSFDHNAKCFRCTVCKKSYPTASLKCDRCGQPPGPRTRIRMKRH
jgi:hypothetical protein